MRNTFTKRIQQTSPIYHYTASLSNWQTGRYIPCSLLHQLCSNGWNRNTFTKRIQQTSPIYHYIVSLSDWQTGQYIPCSLLHQLWSNGWNEKYFHQEDSTNLSSLPLHCIPFRLADRTVYTMFFVTPVLEQWIE